VQGGALLPLLTVKHDPGFGDRLLPRTLRTLRARYRTNRYTLVEGDAIDVLGRLPDASVDLIFADPPYYLSNGGSTCQSGERVAVDKGAWDASAGLLADHAFQTAWLAQAQRVLKPSGTLWVSGTQHVIFSIGFAMQQLGYRLLNTVTWFKPNASPNLSCRFFTHSTELVLWAAPVDLDPLLHVFHYDAMRDEAGDRQMRDMWTITPPPPDEKLLGRHPTQKPVALLDRIIRASTNRGAFVVDPFNGSGTTGVAALHLGRRYLGVDRDPEYLDLTARRLGHPDAPPAPPIDTAHD
jgi:site-specific DNA-methyltransferase (adenine-specific)